MECVTRVFYNNRPPDSHPFVRSSLHFCAFMQDVHVLKVHFSALHFLLRYQLYLSFGVMYNSLCVTQELHVQHTFVSSFPKQQGNCSYHEKI